MAALPTEILQQIFSDGDVRTAKSLRCCCSRFNELASQIVFRRLHIALFDDSLRTVMSIKKDPILRRLVRTVDVLNARLDEKYSNYQVWESELDLRERLSSASRRNSGIPYSIWNNAPRIVVEGEPANYDDSGTPVKTLEMTRERLKYHHEQFLELLSAERCAVNNNMLPEFLTGAFPNLDRIQIHGFPYGGAKVNVFEAYMNKDIEVIPVMTALSRDTLLSWPFKAYDYYAWDSCSSMWYSPLSILGFLTTSENKLRSLDLDILPWCIGRPSSKHRYWPFHSTSRIAFQDLTTLSAQFRTGLFGGHTARMVSVCCQIAKMLNCAVNLQTVELKFCCKGRQSPKDPRLMNWNPDRISDVSEIFDQIRWRKLKTLQLERCGFSEKAFVRFMKAHRTTLRTLRLTDLKMITSDTTSHPLVDDCLGYDWQLAMEQIAPLMSLENVKLEGILDRVQKHRILQFVAWLDGHSHSLPSKAHRHWKIHGHDVAAYLQSGGKDVYPPWPRYR